MKRRPQRHHHYDDGEQLNRIDKDNSDQVNKIEGCYHCHKDYFEE